MEITLGCLVLEIYEEAREGEYCVAQSDGLHIPPTDTKENLMFSVSSMKLPKTWCSIPDMWR